MFGGLVSDAAPGDGRASPASRHAPVDGVSGMRGVLCASAGVLILFAACTAAARCQERHKPLCFTRYQNAR